MFKIYDGRDCFYQWDIDRKLIVADSAINQVHFCNRTDDCSLVCETYIEDGVTVVNVPNILLQSDWCIRAYAYDGKYTKHEACYDVIKRTKPTDYIYTETETLNYNTLLDRMNEIDGNIEKIVDDYYTKDEVDTKIETIELTPGQKGEPGEPGKDGEPGITPVKGLDYWTAEDQAAIINDVLAALPAAEGVEV